MAGKKRKSKASLNLLKFIFISVPKYLALGIYYAFKFIFIAARYLIRILKNKRTAIKRNKMTPSHEEFSAISVQKGSLKTWLDNLYVSDSKIGLILGARGSGKTALGLKLIEEAYINKKRKCYALGFSEEEMPSWVEVIEDISKIKNNSIILVDEGGILFSSRNAMSNANKLLSQLILISRHKNLTIIFISQNSSNLEINVLRQADFLALKPSSLLQKDFERKIIKEIYEKQGENFKKYEEEEGLTYIYSDYFKGFIKNPLPSFWKESISKSFR